MKIFLVIVFLANLVGARVSDGRKASVQPKVRVVDPVAGYSMCSNLGVELAAVAEYVARNGIPSSNIDEFDKVCGLQPGTARARHGAKFDADVAAARERHNGGLRPRMNLHASDAGVASVWAKDSLLTFELVTLLFDSVPQDIIDSVTEALNKWEDTFDSLGLGYTTNTEPNLQITLLPASEVPKYLGDSAVGRAPFPGEYPDSYTIYLSPTRMVVSGKMALSVMHEIGHALGLRHTPLNPEEPQTARIIGTNLTEGIMAHATSKIFWNENQRSHYNKYYTAVQKSDGAIKCTTYRSPKTRTCNLAYVNPAGEQPVQVGIRFQHDGEDLLHDG